MQQRKQPFTIEEFESIYSRVPRLCVDLVVIKEGKILLTLRQKNGWVGQWHLPGGTIYINESVRQCVDRVASEELGLKVKIKKELGFAEYPSEKKERGYGYSVALVFLCEVVDGEVVVDSEVKEFGWFEKLPEKTIEEQKVFLNNFLGQTPI